MTGNIRIFFDVFLSSSCPGCPPGFRLFFALEVFSRLGSVAGGRLLFLEFFLTNLDITIWLNSYEKIIEAKVKGDHAKAQRAH
jgi:hypothetical protein